MTSRTVRSGRPSEPTALSAAALSADGVAVGGGASVVVDAVVSPETSGVAAGEAGAHFSSSPRRVALAFLKQHNILKLIVTDVQMPGRLNGIELANYIGEHWPDISIIVASGAVIPEEGESSDPRSFPQQPD